MKDAVQVHASLPNQKSVVELEDLLLCKLQESVSPLSLNELRVKISPTRPMIALNVAASLARLHRKGKVIKKLAGEGRAYYVYSAKPTQQLWLPVQGGV
jgi:predicted transcriptional regulator